MPRDGDDDGREGREKRRRDSPARDRDRDRRRKPRSRSESRSQSRSRSRSRSDSPGHKRSRRGGGRERDREHRGGGGERDQRKRRERGRDDEDDEDQEHRKVEDDDGEVEEGEVAKEGEREPPGPPPLPGPPPPGPPPMEDLNEAQAITSETNGEISMSVEETNRLRASLGLKPLRDSSKAVEAKKIEEAAHQERVEKQQADAKAQELASRVAEAREKRLMNESYKKVKTLGEPDEGDDLRSWVKKSRKLEEKRKTKERQAALRMARQLQEQDDDAEDSDEDAGGYSAKALAGMKVKHTADELDAGETMILTLEDKSILDESGNLVEDDGSDALVNAAIAEEKKVAKAKRAAAKRSVPLYGEDGKKRALLDKYDEEDAEDAMEIGEDGGVDQEKVKRQKEIRAKLAAGVTGTAETAEMEVKSISDFYTSEEMSALFKPKKKKKKKEKKLRTKDTAELIAALEAEAAQAGGSDLGNRKLRADHKDAVAQEELAKAEKRANAYQAALDKANKASEALRASAAQDAGGNIGDDEADNELQASLARARRMATRKKPAGSGLEQIAEAISKSKFNDAGMEPAIEEGSGLQFTEATEFARAIGAEEIEADTKAEAAEAGDGDAEMEDDIEGDRNAEDKEVHKEEEQKEDGSSQAPGAGVFTGQKLGRGLFGALGALRDRGELSGKKEWSGRTNDMKPVALQGIDNMFEGEKDSRLNTSIEAALTRRDEFGRVMTPKEQFRQLCYAFHGKPPSKNKQEKRLRKYQEELAVKKMEAGDTPLNSVHRLRDAQGATGEAFLVLSGRGAASESSLAAVMKRNEAQGLTPMLGDKKVEMMLGIKKPPRAPGRK